MKTFKSFFVVAVAVTLSVFAARSSFGQAPTGSITNVVSSPTNVIWDATLVPLQTIEMDILQIKKGDTNELFVSFAAPYTQDGKGKLAGTGATQIAVTNVAGDVNLSFPGTYQTKGFIKSNNGLSNLKLASKASGTAFLQGANRTLTGTASYSVKLDAVAGTVQGTVKQKATARGLGSVADTQTFSDMIPAELGDGSWTLVLDFGAPVGTKLAGTATVTLATGQVYPFTFKGTYVSSKNTSKLSLKGVDAGLGSVLTVTLTGSEITLISGKVAGQIIKF